MRRIFFVSGAFLASVFTFSCSSSKADFEDSTPAKSAEIGVEDGGWDGDGFCGIREPGSLEGGFSEVNF